MKRSHTSTVLKVDALSEVPGRSVVFTLTRAGFVGDALSGLTLILAVLLVYLPAWRAGGYLWDDDKLITANPCVVGPLGFKEIWTTKAADICPLTITTFRVEHALWELAPLPYHLVSVLMHGTCAVLLWQLLRRLRVPKYLRVGKSVYGGG